VGCEQVKQVKQDNRAVDLGRMPGRRPGHAPQRKRRPPVWRQLLMIVLVIGLFTSVSLAASLYFWLQRPMRLLAPTVEYSVQPGQSPREVAQGWVDAGVRADNWLLYEWFRWSGDARRIRAGSYQISAGTTPLELLRKMVAGDETLVRVRFIEGWTFRQLRAALASATGLKPDSAALDEAALMAAIGAPGVAAEGHFFPDTYAYARGSSDLEVLRRAFGAMQLRLDEVWAERAADLPLNSPEQMLTLASIVEKETGRAADRPNIAAVFVNRLRIGMPLQTDPTVIYGLGTAFDGNLRRADLERDSPYNTYRRTGLPPTPIALPGRDALLAAARPAQTKAIYFVARGDGTSEFSDNLADHNRAVNKYQRGQ
jgi:UPF0755 protein